MIEEIVVKARNARKTLYKPRRRIKVSHLRKRLEELQKALTIQIYGKDCFTCDAKNLQGKNCHLGHVPWPRTELSAECKFSTDYTRMQCMRCNIHKGGQGAKAIMRMLNEGIDVEYLWIRNLEGKGKTYNRKWFEDKIAEYESRLS